MGALNFYDIGQISEDIRGFWSVRKRALIKKWDFYYGDAQRWYLDKFEGETPEEFQNRVLMATIENHCAKTCDVIVSYLYGQPNARNRTVVRVNDKDGKIIEKAQTILANNIWEYNNIDSFRIDTALMASVTGSAIVHKEFIDKRTGLPFPAGAEKADKIKYGTIRYDLYDTVDSMALPYVATDAPNQGLIYPRVLGAIVRFYNVNNFSGISVLDRLLQKQYGEDEILEVYDPKTFKRSTITAGSTQVQEIFTAQNPYGDINIPFTVFRNYGDPMYIEGTSDLDQMIPLQSVLNEILNCDKATIGYHSYPILKLTGGAKLPPNFIRKVNSVFEMDVNQDAGYLTWDNVLDASDKFKESIRKQMTVVSGVSQLSRGNAADIGQVRSGAGLKTLFQADINAIALKIPHFRQSEKKLAESTLKMWEIETGESMADEYFVDVAFPADFVGLDELLKAQVEQIKLSDSTRTVHESIKESHPEVLSEDDVDKIFKEIVDEKTQLAVGGAPPVTSKEPSIPGESVSTPKNQAPKPQTSDASSNAQKAR
jgi:hypothetical protein